MTGLTPKQAKGLEFIRAYIAEHGHAPSFNAICTGMGFPHKSGAHRLIKQLEERDAIRCSRAESGWLRPRQIEIVEQVSSRVALSDDQPSRAGAPAPTTDSPGGT